MLRGSENTPIESSIAPSILFTSLLVKVFALAETQTVTDTAKIIGQTPFQTITATLV